MTDVLEAVGTARLDLQPVFDIVTHHANRLCDGTGAGVAIRDGDRLRVVSSTGALEQVDAGERWFDIDDTTPVGAAASTMQPVHIRDWDAVDSDTYPNAASRQAGRRSALVVPMVRNDVVIGGDRVQSRHGRRIQRRPGLVLRTFVSQSAIALDNARLLAEIEEQNFELDAALDRQTAMTDVLEAVGTARLDLQPVFDRIVEHAQRLCRDSVAYASVRDGVAVNFVAASGDGVDADR